MLGKTARVLQLGPVETIRSVTLPYAAPYLFTGVKLAVAYAFIGVIGAEFIMSGTGLGYEIRFAYDNLDNNVMYPLILLILLIAMAVNMSLDHWERRCGRGGGSGLMRRTIHAHPSLFLVIVLLVLWQIVFWLVGRDALLPPLETILYLAGLLQTARFWGHIAETGTAFVIALAISVVAGLAIGLALGLNRRPRKCSSHFCSPAIRCLKSRSIPSYC